MYNYTQFNENQVEYIAVAAVDEIPNGERLFIDIDRQPVVIFNIAGKYFAIADVCSHDDGPVGEGELHGYDISCPRHGAAFDVRSGKVLSLPAIVDIPAYPVRVVNGEVQIGMPLE
jgi:3-phenylpropionate/trans-cinnamate dioxygenase ferredoxin subunit